nr:Submandibular gland secretory Glx-rich protein like [Ipomoea batatas]
MLTALRLATARTPPPALCSVSPLPHPLRGRSHIRLRRPVTTGAADSCPDAADDMQKVNDTEKPAAPRPAAAQPPKVGDTMSSFGEGYATRSDEEGFGGIYGGNTQEEEEEHHKIIPGNAPAASEEYGENQGGEVKEKEKGRHQPHHHPST